jgi:hypothetical protein
MTTSSTKRQLIAVFILLSVTFTTIAQSTWDTLPYKSYADFKLQNLNKSLITTGILCDRMFPAADIE